MGGNAQLARNSFLSNLSGVGTEDFESRATGSIGVGLNLSFAGSVGTIGATITGGGPGTIQNSPNTGRFATSGSQYLQTSSGSNFNIAFNSPISAFGFYGTDIGDFSGQVILNLSGGGMETINIGNNSNAPDGSLLFFGFIDPTQTFTNISFTNTGTVDVFGFDDMTIGDRAQVSVPEPMPLALLGLGLAALGLRRRAFAKAA